LGAEIQAIAGFAGATGSVTKRGDKPGNLE